MENGWVGIATSTIGVFMQTPTQDEVLDEKKWSELTASEKLEIIAAFHNECGEDVTLDEWSDFINKNQLKDF